MKELFTKDAKIYIIAIVLVLGYGFGYKLPPIITKIMDQQKQISDLSTQIIDLEKKKSDLEVKNDTNDVKRDIPIAIFKSPYSGTDFESAGMELVYQLLRIIGNTGNKITEISMAPGATNQSAPASEKRSIAAPVGMMMNNAPQSASTTTGTLNVSMTLDCSYITLQNLLQKVSTWNYLAEVKSLNIAPNAGNSNNLIAKISIDLYINQ